MHIVIQTEVAQRLTAQPGSKSYGYLSVLTQLYARPELVLRIPREAFRPPPEVGSALVTLRFPGERAEARPRLTKRISRFCEIVLRAKTQDAGEQSAVPRCSRACRASALEHLTFGPTRAPSNCPASTRSPSQGALNLGRGVVLARLLYERFW